LSLGASDIITDNETDEATGEDTEREIRFMKGYTQDEKKDV